MTVKLIAATKPCIEGVETIEQFISYAARISNPSNQHNNSTAEKLLKYLVNNKHFSPFEIAHFVFEINTTRDIARQILRHRSFSFQEFSQRYADPTKSLGFETREARLQDPKNRQNSVEIPQDENPISKEWQSIQQDIINQAQLSYQRAIEIGIAKEQARAVLPEGLTESRLYMAGTLRSFIHYCEVRMSNGTQKEHREIAASVWEIIVEEVPALKHLFDITHG